MGRVFTIWAVLLLVVVGAPGADVKPSSPEHFRALYLYNFARYTEWPEGAPATAQKFRIGVLGSKPMAKAVSEMLAGQSIKQRQLEIVELASYDPDRDLNEFQVLFIGRDEKRNLGEILRRVQRASVLTVTDIDEREFAASNGIVNFVEERNKLNFVINQTAGEQAGLKFDPRLLNLAKKVYKAQAAKPPGAAEVRVRGSADREKFVKAVP